MKIKKGKILFVGPIVIDTIKKKEHFGGTAANMSYGLGRLGAKPILFSLVGNDFSGPFEKHLEKHGVDLRVHVNKQGKTARYYDFLESSKKRNWFPNAYKNIEKINLNKIIPKKDLQNVTLAIFSSSTAKSMIKHMRELKQYSRKAVIVFDPGPAIHTFLKKDLGICLKLCDIFIVNEKEYTQAKKILKGDPRKLIKEKIIIETRGVKGSIIFQNGKQTKIKAIRTKRVLDTTGAGDAYRAGLIFGLSRGMSLEKACKFGARLASKNVQYIGCQNY